VIASGNLNNGVLLAAKLATVQNAWVGLDPTGALSVPNGGNGIHANALAAGATIGAGGDFGRVVVSGNLGVGIALRSAPRGIANVWVGLTVPDGSAAAPNGDGGISVESPDCVVGRGGAENRVVVSGNNRSGISVSGVNFTVLNALVGLSADGMAPVRNVDFGISLSEQAANATIGAATDLSASSSAGRVLVGGNGLPLLELTPIPGAISDAGSYAAYSAYDDDRIATSLALSDDDADCDFDNSEYAGVGCVVPPTLYSATGTLGSGIVARAPGLNVHGAWIGVGTDGETAVPNIGAGIWLLATAIGATVRDAVISGNLYDGLFVEAPFFSIFGSGALLNLMLLIIGDTRR